MYARTLAWYAATPEKQNVSRAEKIQKNILAQRDEDGNAIIGPTEVHLPEVPKAFENLLALFFSSGQAMSGGMGLTPLTWQEIKAFIEVNELNLMLWEKDILKKMSEAYCGEFSRASDPKRPAPYTPEVEDEEVDKIGKAISFREQLQLLKQNREN